MRLAFQLQMFLKFWYDKSVDIKRQSLVNALGANQTVFLLLSTMTFVIPLLLLLRCKTLPPELRNGQGVSQTMIFMRNVFG